MLLLIATWLYVSWLCLAFGLAGQHWIGRMMTGRSSPKTTLGLDYLLLFGFLLISALAGIITILRPIDTYTTLFFTGLGVLFSAMYYREMSEVIQHAAQLLRAARPILKVVLAGLFLLALAFGISRIFHNDAGLYHVQSVKWIKEYAVVPGLGNLHGRLAFNSHFFISTALFSILPAEDLVVFPLNSFFFFVLSAKLLWSLDKALRQRDMFFIVLSGSTLAFFVYNMLDIINGTSTDAITVTLVLYLFFLFFESSFPVKKPLVEVLIWLIVFTTVTYKLSMVFLVAIIPFTLWRLDIKKVAAFSIIGALVVLPFFYRNIVLSGYLVYPMPSIDLFDYDWKVPHEKALLEKQFIEAWPRVSKSVKEAAYARGEDIKPEEAVQALNASFSEWFRPWFRELGFTMKFFFCVNILSVFLLAWSLARREYKIAVLFGVSLVNFLFWFAKAPDPRFALGFLIFGCTLSMAYIAGRLRAVPLPRPGWVFAALGLLVLPIFLKKDYILAVNDWGPAQLLTPNRYYEAETILIELANFAVRVPVSGDLCMNAPLPCTPYPNEHVEKRGDDFSKGFRARYSEKKESLSSNNK